MATAASRRRPLDYLIHLYDTPALAERGPDKLPTCRVAQLSRLGPKAIIHAAAET
jgi:hypothetical protein